MAQLLVLRPLASLVLVRVRVDRLVDRLRHFLLPALRDDQRKVLVQLLVAVQQLRTDGRRERKRERLININNIMIDPNESSISGHEIKHFAVVYLRASLLEFASAVWLFWKLLFVLY